MANQLQMEDELQSSQQLLLLCFICDINCQMGAVNIQMRTLADNLSDQMQGFCLKLYASDENNESSNPGGLGPGQVGYDPMKDPSKMNVVY